MQYNGRLGAIPTGRSNFWTGASYPRLVLSTHQVWLVLIASIVLLTPVWVNLMA